MTTKRKTYHLSIAVSDDAITVTEVAERDAIAAHIMGDDYEIVVYGDVWISTFVAIAIGRFIERKEQSEDTDA